MRHPNTQTHTHINTYKQTQFVYLTPAELIASNAVRNPLTSAIGVISPVFG